VFVDTPEAAAFKKKLQKGLDKVFDRKINNSDDKAESLTETKETQCTLPLGFFSVERERHNFFFTFFLFS